MTFLEEGARFRFKTERASKGQPSLKKNHNVKLSKYRLIFMFPFLISCLTVMPISVWEFQGFLQAQLLKKDTGMVFSC